MAIDVNQFAIHLRSNAQHGSQQQCAKFVRLALQDAGAKTVSHPRDAKDWGPTLLRNGFHTVTVEKPETFLPMKGDVAVIQPTSSGGSGHIQGFDGKNWISDFVQTGFWPGQSYRTERPSHVVYRP